DGSFQSCSGHSCSEQRRSGRAVARGRRDCCARRKEATMNREWHLRQVRRRRTPPFQILRGVPALFLPPPPLESLQHRRLLTAAGNTSPQLALDPNAAPTSLLVQYRDNASYASSLAAYQAGVNVDEEWAIAPSMREVKLNAGIDLDAALAVYRNDANVL